MEATRVIVKDGWHGRKFPTVLVVLSDGAERIALYENNQEGRRHVCFDATPNHNGHGMDWIVRETFRGDRAAGLPPSVKTSVILVPWSTPVDDLRTGSDED